MSLGDRTKYLGATDVAAVLGLSPWRTPYEVWAEKTGRLEARPASEAMDAGLRLETVVLAWAERTLGPICPGGEVALPGTPIVCHPDARTREGQPVEAKTSGIVGPLHGEWGEEGTDDIPAVYVVQALVQLAACDADCCHVPALLGGRGFRLYRVEANEAVQQEIIERTSFWWDAHVVRDTPPANQGPPPLDVLRRVRRESGKRVPLAAKLVDAWLLAKQRAAEAAEAEELARAAVIAALGDAEIGELPDGRIVAYREQHRRAFSVPESTFRVLRVKKKEALL